MFWYEFTLIVICSISLIIFLNTIYKKIYLEHKNILRDLGTDTNVIVSYTTSVNFPKDHEHHVPNDWTVGFIISERLNGERLVEFTGRYAEEYFTGKDRIYATIGLPVLKGADPKKIRHIVKSDKLIIY